MGKKVSAKELLGMIQNGAELSRDENKIELLVKALHDMIEQNKSASEKHLADIQKSLQVIAEKLGKGADTKEIKSLLTSIASNTNPVRPTYQFDIQRNSRTSNIESVTARPITSVH